MSRLPRLAVGSIQPDADRRLVVWGLLEGLRREGLQVQSFSSRAHFPSYPAATTICGLPQRHLDTWLMSQEVCRGLFARGFGAADVAVIEGQFEDPSGLPRSGGSLDQLCRWLDLPRLAVVDLSRLGRCRLPTRPAAVDGLLLDRAADTRALSAWSTDLEILWGIPVLGALEESGDLRDELSATPRGSRLSREFCRRLGDRFVRYWRPQEIRRIAASKAFARGGAEAGWTELLPRKLTVAVAYDEAFHCYFPCTLDLLELHGSKVVDFSPLHDEKLPPDTDVVYLGCGHPERFADALAANHCMKAALGSHLAAGRRIYGEGGGAAYLCQLMETPSGKMRRMAGVLPAIARLRKPPITPQPIEITTRRSTWLAPAGTRLRGYRNSFWTLDALGAEIGLAGGSRHHDELVGCYQAVGSLLHMDFAATPGLLRKAFFASPGSGEVSDPWTAVS